MRARRRGVDGGDDDPDPSCLRATRFCGWNLRGRGERGYDNQILANDSEEEENVHICLQLMIRSLSLYSLLSPSTLLSVPPLLSALQLPLARSETLDIIGGI